MINIRRKVKSLGEQDEIKIRSYRICKDCYAVKCIWNGKKRPKCKFYDRYNSTDIAIEGKKTKERALTITSEEGRRYLESLPTTKHNR